MSKKNNGQSGVRERGAEPQVEAAPVAEATQHTAGARSPYWMAGICFGLPLLVLLVLAFLMRQS